MGVSKLAEQCSIDYATAKEAKQSYLAVFPGIREINAMMKAKAGNDQPFCTWGGREVYCEPPIVKDNHVQTFDYKMLNYLIQGSAADCTKEAMVAYAKGKRPQDRLLVSVHDELLCQVPLDEVKAGMEALRVSMEGVKFDLPMLSEGKWSADSWAAMKPYDKKGVLLEA
jgi:DNA polymerase I-like protein with 3'-5' exonuclease and polymerase domains